MPSIIGLFYLYPIVLRYGLFDLMLEIRGQKTVSWLQYLNPYRRHYQSYSQGERLRLALQAAGPLYVKFGQALATRRDLLPAAIIDELSKLHDQVPAFASDTARKIVEKSLGQPLENLFADFEADPLGSASIAQVHGARLHTGEAVVVKILRPNIEKYVARDIQLLDFFSRCLSVYSADLKKLGLPGVVEEFKQITAKELDLKAEVANASQLKRNMQDLTWVVIPQVYWPYARENIAVFERIHATPISDKAALLAQNIDLSLLAQRTVELFFTAVFEHNFFHADMHPGNIFVEKIDQEIKYILVDFGIMGTLPENDQRYLAENLAAFFRQDYMRVAQLHIASGWVPADTRADVFAQAIRTVCEPIFSRPPHEISFAELFLGLLETARAFKMEILPQMILLQKTLMNVEGLARYLDPNLDIWQTAKPCLKKWAKQQSIFKTLRAQLRDTPLLLPQLLQLPALATRTFMHFNALKTQTVNNKKYCYKYFSAGLLTAVILGYGWIIW